MPLDLSPLQLERQGDCLHITLSPTGDMLPELPADYDRVLADQLHPLLSADLRRVLADLQNAAAISSRQLGALIAVQRVLRPRFGALPLCGVSDGVRRLLALTRTDELFRLS